MVNLIVIVILIILVGTAVFYIWKEKGEYLLIKMKKLKKESEECYILKLLRKSR